MPKKLRCIWVTAGTKGQCNETRRACETENGFELSDGSVVGIDQDSAASMAAIAQKVGDVLEPMDVASNANSSRKRLPCPTSSLRCIPAQMTLRACASM
jgi:hypothetical protein